jgi:hypothetical protein
MLSSVVLVCWVLKNEIGRVYSTYRRGRNKYMVRKPKQNVKTRRSKKVDVRIILKKILRKLFLGRGLD